MRDQSDSVRISEPAEGGEFATEVFNRFAQRLIGLARKQLRRAIGRKEDPADVVQSVYRSFFRRQREGQFDVESWDEIWRILVVITLRKCSKRIEYFRAARRDVRREVHLPAAWHAVEQLVARDPTPTQATVLADTLEQLMSGLEQTDQNILCMHLQGYTTQEISVSVGFAQRTVRRCLNMVRRRLSRIQADERER
jgi:RNA polymerase sigma factor (sigma-70 family)